MQSGIIEDGTAIGLGLANAVKRLKDSDAISKVVILLTDGVNNRGSVDPSTAAELAKTFGVRVYTIGVGSRGEARSPYAINPFTNQMMFKMMPVEIDEATLQNIADVTGGRYFRATNNEKLREIYAEIDQLERSKIDVKEFSRKKEEYLAYAILALCFIFLDFLCRNTILRTIP
jgi:Ca-activated chloride channel family protein